MTKEQKEGGVITSVSLAILGMIGLLCEWSYGFAGAFFCVDGLHFSCNHFDNSIADVLSTCNIDDVRRIFEFCVDFKHVVLVLIPVILYGLLRATGIVGRLFGFEERIFWFIE